MTCEFLDFARQFNERARVRVLLAQLNNGRSSLQGTLNLTQECGAFRDKSVVRYQV